MLIPSPRYVGERAGARGNVNRRATNESHAELKIPTPAAGITTATTAHIATTAAAAAEVTATGAGVEALTGVGRT